MPHIVLAQITVTVSKHMKWRPWKGLFASKVIYDAFKQVGIEPTFPFKVDPPEKFSPDLKPGTDVSFEAKFWGEEAINASSMLLEGLLALDYVVPKTVNVKEVEEEFEVKGNEEPVALFFEVNHLPTYYRFHGAYVPYPSPQRMVFSIFKKIYEAFGVNAKDLAESVSRKLEVVGGNFSKRVYKVSHGQEVPAFSGKVKYYGIMSEREALALLKALELSKYLGLGQGGGMGFGTVKDVKPLKPSWETPVKVLSH